MNRHHVLNRLRYLRNWECLNIVLLPVCLMSVLRSLQLSSWWLYPYAMALICYILLQGTIYWHLKLRSISTNIARLPAYFHRLFTRFRRSNGVLISMYPVLLGYALLKQHAATHEYIGATVIWVFAVLEHINYYYYQLMHDNLNDIRYLLQHKRLRPAPIATDLARANMQQFLPNKPSRR